MPRQPGRSGARRAGWPLMLAGAVGALVVAGTVVLADRHSTPAVARIPGAAASSAAASPVPVATLFGSPPPALELRPRLVDGAVLGNLTIPGLDQPVTVVEGLVEGAGAIGHDSASAYPGEPHAMVLQGGPLVTLPALARGSVLQLAAIYGVYRYEVTAIGPPSPAAALDAPELRLIVGSGGQRSQVTATLVPGDPQTAAELAQEVAVARAQQQVQATGLLGTVAPGRLLPPCSGPISQGFGPTPYGFEFPFVYNGVYYPHFHTGIDIAIPLGTPIRAAAAGTVVLATTNVVNGQTVGFGTYILIAHGGGLYSLYGHLSALGVHVGDRVQAGQLIGLSGSTGNSTGPHLHFEVRRGTEPVDPMPLLS